MTLSYVTGPPVSRAGVRAAILSAPEIADGDTLATWAAGRLAALQFPTVDYDLDAADLGRIRNSDYERLVLGETGRIVDADLGIHATATLQEIHRSLDNPLETRLVFRATRRSIADRVSEILDRVDDYVGPTEELPADRVNLPGGGDVGDWVGTDDQIDGGEIEDGTIDRLELAQVVSRTATDPQQYTATLLDPVTRSVTGDQVSGCYVPDDTADEIPAGTEVLVLVRSDSAVADGEHHVIVQGGGGSSAIASAVSLTFTGTGF